MLNISTERLELRQPQAIDAPRITELLQEKDVVLMLGRVPWPYQNEDAHWWIDNAHAVASAGTEYPFVITHPDHGLIGSCGVQRLKTSEELNIWEIGYWLGKPYWGQGFITEAASALLGWAEQTLDARGFVSGHISDNLVSGRVLIKLGFSKVGKITHYARGRDCDVRAIRYTRNAPKKLAMQFDGHKN